MSAQVRVAILDDHQSIVDGYSHRLMAAPETQVVCSVSYGEELEPMLAVHPADVLLLDLHVPVSPENPNPYPVVQKIPGLLQKFPQLNVLVISMLSESSLIEALIEAGVKGYIIKDDRTSIEQLAQIVYMVANGGVYFSQAAYLKIHGKSRASNGPALTSRQLEVLSLCAAYPDSSTEELAGRLIIASSTLRNILSGAYLRLGVRTRAAAIAEIQRKGLIVSTRQVRRR